MEVDLSDDRISDRGASVLLGAVSSSRLPRLAVLKLRGNAASREALEELQTRAPRRADARSRARRRPYIERLRGAVSGPVERGPSPQGPSQRGAHITEGYMRSRRALRARQLRAPLLCVYPLCGASASGTRLCARGRRRGRVRRSERRLARVALAGGTIWTGTAS